MRLGGRMGPSETAGEGVRASNVVEDPLEVEFPRKFRGDGDDGG